MAAATAGEFAGSAHGGESQLNLGKAQQRQQEQYNTRHRPMSFVVGDKVLLLERRTPSGAPDAKLKLTIVWHASGPFVVVEVRGNQDCVRH